MPDKLSKRQLSSLKRAHVNKGRRLEFKELRRQRAAERAARRFRPPRRSDWRDGDEEEPSGERVRAPKSPPSAPTIVEPPAAPAQDIGTVMEVRSVDSLVMLEGEGRTLRVLPPRRGRAVDPGARSPLAVGDRVELEPIRGGEARIVRILPRSSALARDIVEPARRDPAHKQQVLAANIDQSIIVCSPAEPPFRPRLIDRYLVAASAHALPAVICLNKADLGVPEEVAWWLDGYAGLGVSILRTSAVTGAGLEEAGASLAGKVSLFTGHSGVGKSSLLNALEPGLSLRVADVTQATAGQGKGRHTTSAARLIPLSQPDTFVVDSPGIRVFGIRGIGAQELAGHFPDIAALATGCPFRDCLHRGEPDCAVAAKTWDDLFLRKRVESYRGMLREVG